MSLRLDLNHSCRDSFVSKLSSHVEPPADDPFTRYSGLPGLRLVRILDPKQLAIGRLAGIDARAGSAHRD
jgi:hypothetical protein